MIGMTKNRDDNVIARTLIFNTDRLKKMVLQQKNHNLSFNVDIVNLDILPVTSTTSIKQ